MKRIPMVARHYPAFWQQKGWQSGLLSPLGTLYGSLAQYRRDYYQRVAPKRSRPAAATIVVGNISVGGTGKTPLVNALVARAQMLGFRPGVILRGYAGKARTVTQVSAHSRADAVGDEALVIARRAQVPVVVGRRRVAAANQLLAHHNVNLIISDDGLQHYALPRDAEIAVIDGERGLGNARCLPAGPLRERPMRLNDVDLIVCNGDHHPLCTGRFSLIPGPLEALGSVIEPPTPGMRIHAVAGIGHPERFFNTLRALGFTVDGHALGDHHDFRREDLIFADEQPVILTEKDAVKCADIAPANSWQLPVTAEPDTQTAGQLEALIKTAVVRYQHGEKRL
ncbi:MAG: tetraacyldisaccharide 4'-kinase [Spiribacter sp.]|nr:tetraacyldisaccharide 4'-kinase [Spiribacter sp.]MDR9489240.1 tetraacyldisaccharide 4'-kinase [Spiribacter sp.]